MLNPVRVSLMHGNKHAFIGLIWGLKVAHQCALVELLRQDKFPRALGWGCCGVLCWLAEGLKDGHERGEAAHMPVQVPLCCQGGQASREALQDVAVLTLQSAVAPLLHALPIQQVGLQRVTATPGI